MLLKLSKSIASLYALLLLTACSSVLPAGFTITDVFTPQNRPAPNATVTPATQSLNRFTSAEKNCLMRAMYFESNRSSSSGMLGVGTVVMNRVDSPKFDNDICTVVGAPRQFAPGVLSREMREERPVELASATADRILAGERHPGVRTAKFFHTAGLTFPYTNMHYVLETGGLAFYIKQQR